MDGGILTARIFNIQRYSIHDGPGIRTVVFFQGCPLRCLWCANPESRSFAPVMLYNRALCTQCGFCLAACPKHAARRTETGIWADRALCADCAECVCLRDARKISGRELTLEEVWAAVVRDEPYYRRSGGGVTLSGGEPLAQPAFAAALLRRCRERGIDTAAETSGHVPDAVWDQILPLLDQVLIDLKIMDPVRHRAATGADNARILGSIRRLARWNGRLSVRIPVIPGWNDDEDNLAASAAFLTSCAVPSVVLLPYHRMGVGKYAQLDLEYSLDADPPGQERMDELCAFFRERGLACSLG